MIDPDPDLTAHVQSLAPDAMPLEEQRAVWLKEQDAGTLGEWSAAVLIGFELAIREDEMIDDIFGTHSDAFAAREEEVHNKLRELLDGGNLQRAFEIAAAEGAYAVAYIYDYCWDDGYGKATAETERLKADNEELRAAIGNVIEFSDELRDYYAVNKAAMDMAIEAREGVK